MPIFSEREKTQVTETPEEASALTIERKEVATPIPVQFKQQVKTDSGKPLIQTSVGGIKTITLPKHTIELENLAKGSISDSITWFAAFWLRMIKKAMHFGWQILTGNK
jgi:hypothetical protein